MHKGTTKLCFTTYNVSPLNTTHPTQHQQHCADCGLDVRRHDHHCVWLAACVGAGNHGRFLLFLALHLLSLALYLACQAGPRLRRLLPAALPAPLHDGGQLLRALCLRPVLPLLLQALFAAAVAVALAALLASQLRTVSTNVTTNERINAHRYPYIIRDPRTGRLRSRFDRGWRRNAGEFVGLVCGGREGPVGAAATTTTAAAGGAAGAAKALAAAAAGMV